jgi:hypothetical protein
MILSACHFDGEPDALMDCHRRMIKLFPPAALDLHVVVTREGGLIVLDACPDLPTQQAFVSSPEFHDVLARVGLPTPRIEVLGEVHFAHLEQSVLRRRRSLPSWRRSTRPPRRNWCDAARSRRSNSWRLRSIGSS